MDKYRSIVILASVAIFLSVVSLVLSWSAYDRTGVDLDDRVNMALEETEQDIDRELALMQARMRLTMLRAEIEAEDFADSTEQELADIRSDLRVAYDDAESDTKEFWREVDSDLEKLQVSVREESSDALDDLGQALDTMSSDLDVDRESLCAEEGGEWRQFSDACADRCDAGDMCAQVITESCDCGPDRCWNGASCEPEG